MQQDQINDMTNAPETRDADGLASDSHVDSVEDDFSIVCGVTQAKDGDQLEPQREDCPEYYLTPEDIYLQRLEEDLYFSLDPMIPSSLFSGTHAVHASFSGSLASSPSCRRSGFFGWHMVKTGRTCWYLS